MFYFWTPQGVLDGYLFSPNVRVGVRYLRTVAELLLKLMVAASRGIREINKIVRSSQKLTKKHRDLEILG